MGEGGRESTGDVDVEERLLETHRGWFEEGGHKPRNVSGLRQLGKAGTRILPWTLPGEETVTQGSHTASILGTQPLF